MEAKYDNLWDTIRITRSPPPDWLQNEAAYFITFRLWDSVPASLLRHWEEERTIWQSSHPEPRCAEDEQEFHRCFSARMELWLDAGHGSCLLRDPAARSCVEVELNCFEGQRHHTFALVIMPNHVHALVAFHPRWPLERLVSSWKRRSARMINALRGSRGTLWQADYFRQRIRDEIHFDNVVRYIRLNPEDACLPVGAFTLFEGEEARRVA